MGNSRCGDCLEDRREPKWEEVDVALGRYWRILETGGGWFRGTWDYIWPWSSVGVRWEGDEQKKGTGEYDGVCPDYLSYIFIPAERKRRGLLTGFQLTG